MAFFHVTGPLWGESTGHQFAPVIQLLNDTNAPPPKKKKIKIKKIENLCIQVAKRNIKKIFQVVLGVKSDLSWKFQLKNVHLFFR